jgi:hypothetical protein
MVTGRALSYDIGYYLFGLLVLMAGRPGKESQRFFVHRSKGGGKVVKHFTLDLDNGRVGLGHCCQQGS